MKTQPSTILFVSHDSSRTGAPIFLLRFLRWVRANTQIPFRILLGASGELLGDFQALGQVSIFEPDRSLLRRVAQRLGASSPDPTRHLASLRDSLLESDIGLVYANTVASGPLLDFLSFLECPVICHVHELEDVIQLVTGGDLGLIRKYATFIIAVSRAVQTNLVKNHGFEEERVRVIHGFVPTQGHPGSCVAESRTRVFSELGIPLNAKLVCACGSIEPRKGADLFLQVGSALSEVYREGPVHFVWVGGHPRQIKEIQKAIPSQCAVHFIGHRSEVAPYYAASDVFVLPSREDPFPLVMLEAALEEKPIVCFDSGGAPEFVETDAGFVVPRFDVTEMAAKIALLISSSELRKQMGQAARAKVLSQHSLETCAPRIAALIRVALCFGRSVSTTT
jgi:glycosyltransferase involved in cell wall biosynthesis